MATVAKEYTPGEIDRAGKFLTLSDPTEEQVSHAMEVMDTWRVLHDHPMELARKTLEARAARISPNPTIGARLKREDSIRAKLQREKAMKLSTMQDIGGCRVILRNMEEVNALVALYENDSDRRVTDYVANPRKSGYRGMHIIWQFRADKEEHKCYDRMRIEIQIRTELQHSWATAVEVCSTFTEQNLKSDHPRANDERWIRFFTLMGSVMAQHEGGGLVPDTPVKRAKLIRELQDLESVLKVKELMRRWNSTTDITDAVKDTRAHQFLIQVQAFEHHRGRVNVTSFSRGQERLAAQARLQLELESRTKPGIQVALVNVQSLETLRLAYPNYYADTTRFLKELDVALHGRYEQFHTHSV